MSSFNAESGRDRSFTPPTSFVPSTFLGMALRCERGTALSSVASVVMGLALGPARWLRRLVVRRYIERELYALSDHLLADIGVTRGNIPHVARAAARNAPIPSQAEVRPAWVARAEFNPRVRSLSAVNDPEFRRAA